MVADVLMLYLHFVNQSGILHLEAVRYFVYRLMLIKSPTVYYTLGCMLNYYKEVSILIL